MPDSPGGEAGILAGRNPIREALRSRRPLRRLLVARGTHGSEDLVAAAREAGVRVDVVPRAAIDARAGGLAHQGVLAEVESFSYRSWSEAAREATARGERPLVLALDGVTDPGNVGSLLRSAEAAGAHAAVLPARRSASVTAVVEKAAAGATSHLPVDRVGNLARWAEEAKAAGLWVVALDPAGPDRLFGHPLLAEPLALVVGAEGPGVSRLVRERADARIYIPLAGRVASLNVAVAGAVALFEALRVRETGFANGAR